VLTYRLERFWLGIGIRALKSWLSEAIHLTTFRLLRFNPAFLDQICNDPRGVRQARGFDPAGTSQVRHERDARRPQGVCKRRFVATERIWFVSQKKQEPFLPLLLRWLAKAHAWPAAVLVDELDAGSLQGSSDCLIVRPPS
jgi:hypothetical protein